jgi:thiamine transport system permease protein
MSYFFLGPALVFLGFLFLVPMVNLLLLGFQGFNHSIFQDTYLVYVIQFTYWQAFVSASLSVLVGFLFAFLIKEWNVFGGKILWKCGLLCSSLPSIIVALGILGSWGKQTALFGWKGLLLGHVFLNFAIPLRLIGNALSDRERTSELTAQSLGMSRWGVFCNITISSIRPSLVSSWILAFLYSSTSLFIVLFLGGGPRFTTLEVALYEAVKLNLDNGRAIQIALLQAGVGAFLFFFYLKLQKKTNLESDRVDIQFFAPRRAWMKGLGGLCLWGLSFMCLGFPLVSIFVEGLGDWSFLDGAELLEAGLTTFAIATSVVVLSISILYPYLHYLYQVKPQGETSGWIWLIAIPQFFSSLVVALALSVFFPLVREVSWLSYLAVVSTQTLFVIPLIQFPLREGFLRMSKERNWIAQSLGASGWQRWLWVELPFMKRSLFLSALIGFGFSMGEVISILLFSPPGIKTLAMGIFQAMSRYRFQEARATTVVLLVVMISLFGIAGYLEDRDESSAR